MKKYLGWGRRDQDERMGTVGKKPCEVESFFATKGSYSVAVMR
jgi:hypothetical protein